MKRLRLTKRNLVFVTLISISWPLSSCRPSLSYIDVTGDNKKQSLPLPQGEYSSMAWLADDQVAFEYGEEFLGPSWKTRIVVYTISIREWQEVPAPSKPNECFSAWAEGPLARLPNGNLGFIYRCNLEPIGDKETLYMWDRQADSLQVLQQYPENIAAAGYTFSPDMSELIQESAVGAGLNDELYRVHSDGHLEQLFATYQRVRTPSWSPDGNTIAFMGTESYPGGDSKDFDTFAQIEDLLKYPWDIYLMDADGRNERIVVPMVSEAGILKWSPQDDLLAFAGTYQGTPGIWVFDPNSAELKLTRIWRESVTFDWSPDGRRMFIIEREWKDEVRYDYPAIIDVPLEDN